MTEVSPSDGTRLRLARQARGLSQQQLAGVAGVTRQAVSAVESGHSDPSLRVALGLARALGMTVEELFGPGELGDPVLAQPVATPGGPGSRVALATVGDRFVALPLHADTAARLGFGPAGGLVASPSPGTGGQVPVRPIGPPRPTVVVAGCDPALPLLNAARPARPAAGLHLVALWQRRGPAAGRRWSGARRRGAPCRPGGGDGGRGH